MHEVGLQPKASLAAAGTAHDQHVFVPGRFGVLGAAVHCQALRLGEDDVVLELRGYIGGDILSVAPTGCTVLRPLPVLLGILAFHVDGKAQTHAAGDAHQQIDRMKAGSGALKRQHQPVHDSQKFIRQTDAGGQPPRLSQFGGAETQDSIRKIGNDEFFQIDLFHRTCSFRFSRSILGFFT